MPARADACVLIREGMSEEEAAVKTEYVGSEEGTLGAVTDAGAELATGVIAAAEAGATAAIQPGGSMRDEEVIAAANERGVAMVFTGNRHFRH